MADKNKKLTEIKDPSILEGEVITAPAPASHLKEITDSDINSGEFVDTPAPRPAATPAYTWEGVTTPSSTTPSAATVAGVTPTLSGYKPKQPQSTPEAVEYVARDFLNTRGPSGVFDVTAPTNQLNQITSPTGDPEALSNYLKERKAQLQQQYSVKTNPEIADLEANVSHILAQQLFNQEYSSDKLKGAGVETKLQSLASQRDKDISIVDDKISDIQKSDLSKQEKDMRVSTLNDQKAGIEKKYQADQTELRSNTKYDPIILGAQYSALMGDVQAQKDLALLQQGKGINPSRQYQYNIQGNDVLRHGMNTTPNESAQADVAPHIEEADKNLYANNKPFILDQARQQVGNQMYNTENPLLKTVRTLIPSGVLPSVDKEDIAKYGKESGLSDEVIKELQKNPELIPKPASIWQQFVRGYMNTAAPIYEQGVRLAGHIIGGDEDAINQAFQPGWENQKGIGAAIAGNMPSDQNTYHNVRGVLGQIMEGAGGLSSFAGEIGLGAKALEGTGIAAGTAEKLSNFGIMSFNGYNDAYNKSLDVIGDKPEDEAKRQLYSAINGIATGAIFSISPKTQLIKNALGDVEKTGNQLLTEIKDNGIDILQKKEGKELIAQHVQEMGKELGVQVGLGVSQKIAQNITDIIANPEKKTEIGDNVKETAISTALAMALPAILGGYGHVRSQTPLNAAASFEIGSHPDLYKSHISQMIDDGKLTPEQATQMFRGVDMMQGVIARTPVATVDGKPLSPDQIKAYSYALLQQQLLQNREQKIKAEAEATGTSPDKAQIQPIAQRIGEVEKVRTDIMEDPQGLLPLPEPEKKPGEKVAGEEKQFVPSQPQVEPVSQQKTTSHEKDNVREQERRISSTESESGQEGPGAEEAADREQRDELAQDRKLTPEPSGEQPVVKQPEAATAPKKRKKLVLAPEEEYTPSESALPEAKTEKVAGIPITETSALQTQDLGNIKGQPEAKTEGQLKEVTTNQPDKPADIFISKEPTGESFNEAVKRVRPAVEELAKNAPDNTVVVAHSWILKLIKSVQELGGKWDHEDLPTLHQKNGGTEPGDILPYKTEDGRTIWFVRHGETEANLEDLQRPNDVHLTDKGKDEAKIVADQLKEKGVTSIPNIITSDLPRAKETADIIAKEFESLTPKTTKHATEISSRKGQEGDQQGGEPEHPRVSAPREEGERPQADRGDSGKRSQEVAQQEQPKKKLRNQSKKGWSLTAYLKRKESALRDEPSSMEEYVLRAMAAMNDKNPEGKWAISSLEKEMPGGTRERIIGGKVVKGSPEERAILRQFASDHPKATPIDQWAADIVRSYGEKYGNLGFHVPDESEIINMVIDNVSRFPSKHALLEHLESMQEERRKKEFEAQTEGYERIPVGTDEKGETVFDYVRKEDIPSSHDLAQMYVGVNDADFKGYDDEGHPVYQEIVGKYDAIDNAKLTAEDEKAIIDFYRHHFNEETGVVNYDAAHSDYNGMKELKKGLSEAGRKLLDEIIPFNSFEQHSQVIQDLIKRANEYEKQSREAAGETTAEAGAGREGAPEGRGAPPKPESKTATETGKPTISNKKIADAFRAVKEKLGRSDLEGLLLNWNESRLSEDGDRILAPVGRDARYSRGKEGGNIRVGKREFIDWITSDAPFDEKVYGKGIGENKEWVRTINDAREALSPHVEKATPENKLPEEKPQPEPAIDNQQRLKEIEEDLTRQRASQLKEQQLRQKAIEEKDREGFNKHNENWYKKQERIDRLLDERERLVQGMAEDEIKQTYAKGADRIRAFGQRLTSGSKGMVGSFPGLNPHVVRVLFDKVAYFYEKFGNVHVAIMRAIDWAQKEFKEEPAMERLQPEHFHAVADMMFPAEQQAPEITNKQHLGLAQEALDHIQKGEMTFDEVVSDILDSENVRDKTKGAVINYIEWHLKDRGLTTWDPLYKPTAEEAKAEEGTGEPDETSIKNDTTRLRRAQFGLDEEIQSAKKEFGETWDEAKKKIEDGYDPRNLIEELSKHPRPLTDVENAILLHQQRKLESDLYALNDNINKAAERDDVGTIAQYKTTKARVLDELQQLYDVNKAVGTENARGLAARRMMVDAKYSLTNMIAEKRATANDGKPLSEEQEKEVEELHRKIQETQEAFDNYMKQAESQIINLQEKVLSNPVKDKKTASAKLREWADKIEQANKNIAYSSPIPITPKMVAEAIRIVAAGVEKGEQLIDLVKNAVGSISKSNPGVDEQSLQKEINKALIDAGVLEQTKETKKAKDMSGLFTDGRLDREAVRLKVEADRAKAEYDINIKRDKQKELSRLVRAQSWLVRWQRAYKLSNPITMGKLMMAGLTRTVTTPLEDIVGGAYSALLPRLAKGAIGEGGGLNISETAKAYKNGIMLGIKDAADIWPSLLGGKSKITHGKSDLDVLFGKAGELPPEAMDLFGQLHSAVKAPFKRIIFERSLERRLRRNLANGVDVTDPMVQTSIMIDAYKDANRAIFMQDNTVAEGYQKMVRYLERVDPKTGKAPGMPVATTLKWLIPFIKVPTNIAAEIGTHTYGTVVGSAKLIHAAFTKGIENLTEQEKDIIMRNLKKGTLGAAALALGYFNPQNFGGFYQPGQKRKEDDAEALGLKLFGVKIPAWFVEAPIFQAMQLGATVRRVKDSMVHGEEKGLSEGLWAGALGLVQRVPLADQPIRVGKLFASPNDRQYYLGELAKSTVDPALITYLAKVTDPADKGTIARKIFAPENRRKSPKTIMEHIKSGLPYFREDLEEKPAPREE